MGLVRLIRGIVAPPPPVSADEFRRAKPRRAENVEEKEGEDGILVLTAPLDASRSRMLAWMASRAKETPMKSFELEPVGALVWSLCDGRHTFESISQKLRDRYKMNRLEADAALSAFLKMLGQRGLITVDAPKTRTKK